MKKILFVSLMSFAFLSACGSSGGGSSPAGGNNGSVNADGKTCSDKFMKDAAAYVNASNALNASHSDADARTMKNVCDTFRAHHAKTVTCQYKDADSGQTYNLSASGVYDACKKVDDALNGNHGDNAPMALAGNTCSDQFFADYNALNAAVAARDNNEIANKCAAFKARNSQMDVCDTVVNKNGASVQIHVDGADVYSFCARQ